MRPRLAIRPAVALGDTEWSTFVVTCLIGLLHGLGFSFVLQNILQVTSSNIWQSLLAFNVGVEIGQLAIVLTLWPLFQLLHRAKLRRGGWHRSEPQQLVSQLWEAGL